MEYTTDDIITLLVSTVLPLFVSLFKDTRWSGQAKVALTLVLCFLSSVVIVGLTTQDFSDILKVALQCFSYTSILYQFLYKNMKLNEVITNIPSLFSPVSLSPSPFLEMPEKAPEKPQEARKEESHISIPEEVPSSVSEAPRGLSEGFQYVPGTFEQGF